MAGVSATLEFDAQAAFDAVDQIDAAFSSVAQDFAVQLGQAIEAVAGTPIEPEVDTATITADIDAALAAADGAVTVDADVSGIPPEVDSALADTDTTVVIDGDTSGLQESVSSATDDVATLGDTASSSSGSLGDLSGASAGVGAAAGAAQGDISGLTSAIGGMSASSGAAVGALVAVGGAAASFFGDAVEAAGAQERFNAVLGDSAAAVQNVDVGGLNTDLGELAIRAGTSDEAMLGAVTRIFGIGQAMGEARPQLESTTETLAAVATNASLLNPALGDAATATASLFNAASTGRQRSLQQFGINLNKTQIDALAVEQGLAATTEEVTAFDRATVIANEALSQTPDLLTSINQGASNTEVTLDSLKERFGEVFEAAGQPLITPGFDLLGAALPPVEALADAVGSLAAGVLPAFTGALVAVTPPLQLVANIVGIIPGPVYTAAAAFFLVSRALPLVAAGMNIVWARTAAAVIPTQALALSTVELTTAQTAATASSVGLAGAIGAVVAVGVGGFLILRNYVESLDEVGLSEEDAASSGAQLVNAISEQGSAVAAITTDLRAAADANRTLSDALVLSGSSAAEFANLIATTSPDNFGGAISAMAQAVEEAGGSAGEAQTALSDYAASMLDAAEAAIQAAVANGTITQAQADNAIETAAATSGVGNYVAALGLLPQVAQQSEQAIQAMTDAVAANVPTLADSIAEVDRAGEAFGILNASTDPQAVIDNLSSMVQAFANFGDNIATIGQTSSLVATTLATLGPDVAGPFVAALAEAPAAVTQQLDFVLQVAQQKGIDLQAVLTGFTSNGIAGATAALEGSAGEFGAAGSAAGTAGATGVDQGLSANQAGEQGRQAGQNFGVGVGNGIDDTSGLIGQTATRAVTLVAVIAFAGSQGRVAGQNWGVGVRVGIGDLSGAITAAGRAAVAMPGVAASAGAQGRSIGQNLGIGIRNGIADLTSSISSAAASAVNQAAAAARAAADSNSPSRVFMAIGRDLGEGMSIGIASRNDSASAASGSLVDAAVVGARAAIAGSGTLAIAAGAGTAAAAAGGSAGGTVFAAGSIVVSVSGPVTSRELQQIERATATGVDAALERRRLRTALATGRS